MKINPDEEDHEGIDNDAEITEKVRQAAQEGKIRRLKSLLKGDNNSTKNQEVAMDSAAKNRQKKTMEYLLTDAAGQPENCHLILAGQCMVGNLIGIKELMRCGEKFHREVPEPILWAAQEGEHDIVRFILHHEPEMAEHRSEAFDLAVAGGHLETAKLLHGIGATRDTGWLTTLGMAAANGHIPVAQWLIKTGSGIDDMHGDALSEAAKYGKTKMVEFLLKAGADVEKTHGGAADNAAEGGHRETARALLAAYTDTGLKNLQTQEGIGDKTLKAIEEEIGRRVAKTTRKINSQEPELEI